MSGLGIGIGLSRGGGNYTLSGTLKSATEQDIIDGGMILEIILNAPLSWNANVGNNTAETTALLDGITGEALNATDWDSVVRPALDHTHVTRVDAQTCRIALPAVATYLIPESETIEVVPPAAAVDGSAVDLKPRSFTIREHPVSIALSGTALSATQGQIRAGGRTIIITLSNGTFDSNVGAADNVETAALLAGLSGDGEGALNFETEVLPKLDFNDVALSGGDTVCTITLDSAAAAAYNPVGDEEITVEVPASIIDDHSSAIDPDTFDITEESVSLSFAAFTPTESEIIEGGETLVGTVDAGILGTAAEIAAALSFDGSLPTSTAWDAVGPSVAASDISRDSDVQFTWTLPAAAAYAILAAESVQGAFASSGLQAHAGAIGAPSAFTVSVVTVTMALSGTADGATQTEIRFGNRTLIATLTDGEWEPDIGTADNASTQAAIEALSGNGNGSKRFDAEVRALLDYTDLALSGGNTVLTFTLPGSGYNPIGDEDVTFDPTAALIANYNKDVAGDSISITEPTPTIEISEFEPSEVTIQTGGAILTGVISNGVLGTPGEIAGALSFDGSLSEPNSWDTSGPIPQAAQITRVSDTVFQWTLPAAPDYEISTDETVQPSFAVSGLEAYAGASIADPDSFETVPDLGDADSWDQLVDAAGGGDETGIQDAIDALGANPGTIWIKQGVYDEAPDFNEIGIHAYFEPLTEVDDSVSTGEIDVTAQDVHLELGPGCTVDGDITVSAKGGAIVARNGLTARTIWLEAESARLEGGGFGGAVRGGVYARTGSYIQVEDVTINSKLEALSNANLYVFSGASFSVADTLYFPNSDAYGIRADEVDLLFTGIHQVDGDDLYFRMDNDRSILALSTALAPNGNAADFSATAQNNVTVACVLEAGGSGDPLDFAIGADENIAAALRTDGAVDDNGAGNVVGANDTTAF